MTGLVNSWCGFHGDLEEVWLGDVYPDSYFDHFTSDVRDAFLQINEWTREDLAKIKTGLEKHGVIVKRPAFESIDDFVDDTGRLLRPPISPRDNTLVLGDHLYQLGLPYNRDPWRHELDAYKKSGSTIFEEKEGPWACVSPPCLVRFGKDIFVDYIYHQHVWGLVAESLVELAKKFRIHISMFDGHSDCVFCPVEDKLLLSTEYKKDYSVTYPGWELYWLNNNPVRDRIVKTTDKGCYQWHVPGDVANNKTFAEHIDQFAKDWVGQADETIFDVNLLKVNDNTIFSVGEDDEMNEFLAKRGYNVESYDFRCKTFWDSGIHCLTSDIRRTGECPDFFPENKSGPGLNWLLDNE
jgi:hypothetical protein